jgi:protein associated with RNAse G/E
MEDKIYEYKGKLYRIFSKTKIKIDGNWVNGIIYQSLYYHPDGSIWTRTEEEFFRLFKENSNPSEKSVS